MLLLVFAGVVAVAIADVEYSEGERDSGSGR